MRIGFDGSSLSNRRGFGRFSRLLLQALGVPAGRPTSSWSSSTGLRGMPSACPRASKWWWSISARRRTAAASSQGRRRIGDMLAMGRAVARSGLDLIYFPATYTFFPVWNVPRLW